MSTILATDSTEFVFDEETTPGDETDGVLLDRFLTHRDGAAFEALVLRHGPKVLRVCRRWLGDSQDAEDAFQATFVVLVNRAGAIRRSESLEAWLCGVARRVAGRAKTRADRRRRREGAEVDIREVPGAGEPVAADLNPLLRAEVDRLPEKYRRPLELCYWQGLSNEEAAERLQCPTGTLKWRLSRGREILKDRLARMGVAMAVLLLWRRPATAAGGSPYPSLHTPVLPRLAGSRTGQGLVAADLVRKTVELATLARDLRPPGAKAAALAELAGEAGRRRRLLLKIALPVAIVTAALVATVVAAPIFRSSVPPPPLTGTGGGSPEASGPEVMPAHCQPSTDEAPVHCR